MARRSKADPQVQPEQEVELRSYQIQWTDRAIDTLDEVWAWLSESSEEKADAFQLDALQRIEQLAEHPRLGPVVSELSEPQNPLALGLIEYLQDKRQLVISKHYRAIYQVDEKSGVVYILFIHPTLSPLSRILQGSDD